MNGPYIRNVWISTLVCAKDVTGWAVDLRMRECQSRILSYITIFSTFRNFVCLLKTSSHPLRLGSSIFCHLVVYLPHLKFVKALEYIIVLIQIMNRSVRYNESMNNENDYDETTNPHNLNCIRFSLQGMPDYLIIL